MGATMEKNGRGRKDVDEELYIDDVDALRLVNMCSFVVNEELVFA